MLESTSELPEVPFPELNTDPLQAVRRLSCHSSLSNDSDHFVLLPTGRLIHPSLLSRLSPSHPSSADALSARPTASRSNPLAGETVRGHSVSLHCSSRSPSSASSLSSSSVLAHSVSHASLPSRTRHASPLGLGLSDRVQRRRRSELSSNAQSLASLASSSYSAFGRTSPRSENIASASSSSFSSCSSSSSASDSYSSLSTPYSGHSAASSLVPSSSLSSLTACVGHKPVMASRSVPSTPIPRLSLSTQASTLARKRNTSQRLRNNNSLDTYQKNAPSLVISATPLRPLVSGHPSDPFLNSSGIASAHKNDSHSIAGSQSCPAAVQSSGSRAPPHVPLPPLPRAVVSLPASLAGTPAVSPRGQLDPADVRNLQNLPVHLPVAGQMILGPGLASSSSSPQHTPRSAVHLTPSTSPDALTELLNKTTV